MMKTVARHVGQLRDYGRRLGPYLLVELLLPGGTLLALLLFLCQRARSERLAMNLAPVCWRPAIGVDSGDRL